MVIRLMNYLVPSDGYQTIILLEYKLYLESL